VTALLLASEIPEVPAEVRVKESDLATNANSVRCREEGCVGLRLFQKLLRNIFRAHFGIIAARCRSVPVSEFSGKEHFDLFKSRFTPFTLKGHVDYMKKHNTGNKPKGLAAPSCERNEILHPIGALSDSPGALRYRRVFCTYHTGSRPKFGEKLDRRLQPGVTMAPSDL